jgi:cardiolipin synthase
MNFCMHQRLLLKSASRIRIGSCFRPSLCAGFFNDAKKYVADLRANKNINTIPNQITMGRILASPFLCVALVYDYKKIVLGGIVVCAFSDWLDGYLAKKLNQQTIFGGMIDPIADKVFLCSLTTGLTILNVVPFPLAVVMIGRDVLLVACTFVIRAIEKPPHAPFFDTTTSATLEVTPSKLSKVCEKNRSYDIAK